MRYRIDLSGVQDRAQLHEAIRKGLELPEHYGRNMDALWDCLTEMETPCEVFVRNVESLPEKLKDSVTAIFEEAAEWHGARGRDMRFFYGDKGLVVREGSRHAGGRDAKGMRIAEGLPSYETGTYNMVENGFPCMMSSKGAGLGKLMAKLRSTVREDRRLLFVDGRTFMVCINWIRDHIHEMKAFKHWEQDLTGFMDFILDHQSDEGWFYEMVKQTDDMHWSFVSEKYAKKFEEDHVAATRLELEADIEYLMVEGAVRVYRAMGNDEWIKGALAKLEKGIEYMLTDETRWDAEHGLVKRPFTIDTWDFTWRDDAGYNRRIEKDTTMSIMHGDNSGMYQAMKQLAWLRRRFGDEEKAAEWERRAEELRANMMKYLWNGDFFMHQLHLGHDGVDDQERVRLSMSNAYDVNRGVTTLEETRRVIAEYKRRKETTKAFAEWFSIDPPYMNKFGRHAPGTYVNGGITPFTAGELARAAFRNGEEEYGWDIIQRLDGLIAECGELYFLYGPETKKNLAGGPSGWGAAAVMCAIEEGLAGIEDLDVQYRVMGFSPRWVVTEHDEMRYVTGCEAAKTRVDVRHRREEKALLYILECPSEEIRCHVLLPKGRECAGVRVNGEEKAFERVLVGESAYADFVIEAGPGAGRDKYGWAAMRRFEIEVGLE